MTIKNWWNPTTSQFEDAELAGPDMTEEEIRKFNESERAWQKITDDHLLAHLLKKNKVRGKFADRDEYFPPELDPRHPKHALSRQNHN